MVEDPGLGQINVQSQDLYPSLHRVAEDQSFVPSSALSTGALAEH